MDNLQRPQTATIINIISEAQGISSIYFDKKIDANPGQFIMLWIPGMDEKPFAIAYLNEKNFGITVAAVGPFSNVLCGMKVGERIGIRGPYGTGYSLENAKKIAMVGGGYGSASLALLAEQAAKIGSDVIFIAGARSKDRVIYEKRIRDIGVKELIITTDDGSYGRAGRVTDALTDILAKEKIDKVFACGPDKMLAAIRDICLSTGTDCELSIERYMKCGFGLCGHCCIDPLGIRVCVEGPVISAQTAKQLTELGSYHRVKSSRKEKLH